MKKIIKLQIALAVPLVIVGGFFAYFLFNQVYNDLDHPAEYDQGSEDEKLFYSRLSGLMITEEKRDALPVAIMIENHVASRPQSGLVNAQIVYEILVESTITRFLAIYDLTEDLDKIGPVRSARPYFVDLASEYGALYAHSGGSPVALDYLKTNDLVINLDEFFGYNTGYFWRDSNRYAPHNLFTSKESILQAKEHYQLQDGVVFDSWKYKDGGKEEVTASEIKIDYSKDLSHQVLWRYIEDVNKYERWQSGKRHTDTDGSIIEADNVIVQYVNTTVIDSIGRKDIDLIGQGNVVIFRDGLSVQGTWKKANVAERTRFYDADDNEIELNKGKTWIQVVSSDMEVIF